MPSDRQIAANRNNAKKSTGPRSKEGREASGRNARRHGLAINIGTDPAFYDDIEKLANALSRFSGTQKITEYAREAAEAALDLSRIRKARASLFEMLCLVETATPDSMAELNDRLAKLERYERRAFSRQKRALRAMS